MFSSWAFSFSLFSNFAPFNKLPVRVLIHFLLAYWILGSFFPLGDFSQLAALPAFWHHYQVHKIELNQDISVLSFLRQHYSNTSDHQHPQDSSGHHDLPLKTLQDFQWIGVKCLSSSFSLEALAGSSLPGFFSTGPSEGIPDAVFRPPLSV